ncbi:MAG: hypothetical protein P9M07_08070 [Candidatus Aceula meridiana]|nr:hypothetical protein [Candidatus Aceula meridiana]
MVDPQDPQKKETLNDILGEYDQKESEEQKRIQKEENKKEVMTKGRQAFIFLGFLLVTGLSLRLIFILLEESRIFYKPDYWIAGGVKNTDYKVNECAFKLWNIRKAIDLYYAENKKFPEDLDELYTQKFLHKKIICPVSGRGYLLQQDGSVKKVCCPNPQEHGLKGLCMNFKSGPPFVERKSKKKATYIESFKK